MRNVQAVRNPEQDPDKFFKAGLMLLKEQRPRDAMVAFEHALKVNPDEPTYMSYLGLALALGRVNTKKAIELCRKAVQRSYYQPELFHNLGQVYMLSGDRRRAREALIKGLEVDRHDEAILTELTSIGMRRSPPIPFLSRDHLLNKYLGKVLARVGLRR